MNHQRYRSAGMAAAVAGVLSSICPRVGRAQAEPDARATAPGRGAITVMLGAGPSAFSGLEGDPLGAQGVVAAEYRRGHSPFGIRAELAYHGFRTQDLYPCIAVGPTGCYDTSRRATTAIDVAATYRIFGGRRARPATYAIAGAGLYSSRRVAVRYAGCSPDRVCADAAERTTFRDTDVGVNVGAGLDFAASGWPVFAELRWHSIRPGGGRAATPTRDTRFASYSLVPFTLGLRF